MLLLFVNINYLGSHDETFNYSIINVKEGI